MIFCQKKSYNLNHVSQYILYTLLHIKLFNASTCTVWNCSSIHLFIIYLYDIAVCSEHTKQ